VVCTGGRAFVSQAYAPYIHHSSPKTSSTWKMASQDSRVASTEFSWVRVNAKTRSKKISRVLTRNGSSSLPGCWPGGLSGGRAAGYVRGLVPGAGSAAMSVRYQPPRIRIRPAAW
jgi:hypothetical protein